MDFCLRRIENQNMHYFESGESSEIQLVFLPGGFNPGLWRQQLTYFSRSFKTVSFSPMKSKRGFKGEKKALKNVLDQEKLDNAILISNLTSAPIAQDFEERGDVFSTVFTGLNSSLPLTSRKIYRFFWLLSCRKPKFMRKFLFGSSADYRIVKDFAEEVEVPDYSDFKSFVANYRVSIPSKKSLVVYSEEDRFSSLKETQRIGEKASQSLIKRAGTFPFYEKPQEYNKVLKDYLEKFEREIQKKKIVKAKTRNRSLSEFDQKRKKKVKVNQ